MPWRPMSGEFRLVLDEEEEEEEQGEGKVVCGRIEKRGQQRRAAM